MSAIGGMIGSYAAGGGRDLAAVLAPLAARAPDGVATAVDPRAEVALGARLLRTAGPGPDAPAVLRNEDGSLWMVCDGRVFNADEVTGWLAGRGHSIRSADPCEALLHLYEEEGPAGWKRADAQFALAVWDHRRRRLVLARDYLGVRPLYYAAGPGGLAFASEIKALLQHPRVPRAVDDVGLSHYLTFLNVPAPRTLFAGISKVPPGTAVTAGLDGAVSAEQYWDLLDEPVPESGDERGYVDRVRELHRAAVARRAVDGPIAALLSGGNDSSANAAHLARMGRRPLHTFTVGLADLEGQPKYTDLHYARQVADLIGSEHHELRLTTGEFLDSIPATVDALDDMVSEPSSVFLHHALRMARDAGCRVVVTGEANDEISCGHGEMARIRDGYYARWAPYLRKPRWVRRLAAAVAPVVSPARTDVLRRAAAGQEYFWNFETAWMDTDKADILSPAVWDRCRAEPSAAVVDRYAARWRGSPHGGRDYLSYIVYAMMQDHYFGNLMLGKLDLLAGRLGVEPRCPYTEPQYARFAYNVPAALKTRDGHVKYFFKKAIEGLLPDEIIYRPKQGFRTPVVELFQGALGDWARPILLDGGLTRTGVLRRDHLGRLLDAHRRGERDYSNRLWTAMALNLWYDRWVAGSPAPAGPAEPARPVPSERPTGSPQCR